MENKISNNLFDENVVAAQLNISVATLRNWIKLKKITKYKDIDNKKYFSKKQIDDIKKSIHSNKTALKSRRNKIYKKGNSLYTDYINKNSKNIPNILEIIKQIENGKIKINNITILSLIFDLSIKLLLSKNKISNIDYNNISFMLLNNEKLIFKYLPNIKNHKFLFDETYNNKNEILDFIDKYNYLFDKKFYYEENEDIIGFLYISLKNISDRKSTGAYYTPNQIVEKLIENTIDTNKNNQKILDPSCGTGNFLIKLPNNIEVKNIFGIDIDKYSIIITKINLYLKFGNAATKNLLNKNIICADFLKTNIKNIFNKNIDIILGNPPWGAIFSTEEKTYLIKNYSTAKNIVESFNLFLEKSILSSKNNNIISFILPETILNVKNYREIRKIIIEKTNINYIEYLGNVFSDVLCPSIILKLQITNKKFTTKNISIKNNKNCFTIKQDRKEFSKKNLKNNENYIFDFFITDETYDILNTISKNNVVFLKNNSKFALGIITGDNEKLLTNKKSKNNSMILRGNNILKYNFLPSDEYIVFDKSKFQQVAKESLYFTDEKLLYRFICNQLVFAYDNNKTLSLNSCNILIPKIENMNIKYILAILNSSVMQFYYKNKFNSIKILRSHIEKLPIIKATKQTEEQIVNLVEKILSLNLNSKSYSEDIKNYYNQIDKIIFSLYNLSNKQISYIKKYLSYENNFLAPY